MDLFAQWHILSCMSSGRSLLQVTAMHWRRHDVKVTFQACLKTSDRRYIICIGILQSHTDTFPVFSIAKARVFASCGRTSN